MTEVQDVKQGDRVRYTVEGVVTWAGHDWINVKVNGATYFVPRDKAEVIEKPLVVGDVVTEQNRHLLPAGKKYILADKDGDSWDSIPGEGSVKQYAPFTLVYIHGASDESE